MNPKTNPGPSLPPKAEQATHSANWSEREHVSAQSQVAAQALVDAAESGTCQACDRRRRAEPVSFAWRR